MIKRIEDYRKNIDSYNSFGLTNKNANLPIKVNNSKKS